MKRCAVYYKENTEKINTRCIKWRKANVQKYNANASAKARARRVTKREALNERIAVAVAASNKEIAERA